MQADGSSSEASRAVFSSIFLLLLNFYQSQMHNFSNSKWLQYYNLSFNCKVSILHTLKTFLILAIWLSKSFFFSKPFYCKKNVFLEFNIFFVWVDTLHATECYSYLFQSTHSNNWIIWFIQFQNWSFWKSAKNLQNLNCRCLVFDNEKGAIDICSIQKIRFMLNCSNLILRHQHKY